MYVPYVHPVVFQCYILSEILGSTLYCRMLCYSVQFIVECRICLWAELAAEIPAKQNFAKQTFENDESRQRDVTSASESTNMRGGSRGTCDAVTLRPPLRTVA